MANKLIGILFALPQEARPFLRLLRKRKGWGLQRLEKAPCPAWKAEDNWLILQTGMGAMATERALDWVLSQRSGVRQIVSAGFCGSLIPSLRCADLVEPVEILGVDGKRWQVPGCAGTLLSVATPLTNIAERQSWHSLTGAWVVDMESATVAARCMQENVSCAMLRVVSDDLEHPLPEAITRVMVNDRVQLRCLLGELWRRPSLGLELFHLSVQIRRGGVKLAEELLKRLTMGRREE